MVVSDFVTAYRTAFSSIANNGKTVGSGIEIDREGAVVGGVGSWMGLRYFVVSDAGVWLV